MVSLSNHVYNSTTYITLRQAQGDKKDFCKSLYRYNFIYNSSSSSLYALLLIASRIKPYIVTKAARVKTTV
jgi:hypothetical protein